MGLLVFGSRSEQIRILELLQVPDQILASPLVASHNLVSSKDTPLGLGGPFQR